MDEEYFDKLVVRIYVINGFCTSNGRKVSIEF